MKNRITYTDEPMGELKVVRDFLPPPSKLVFKEDAIKVTIALNRSSVAFFKKEADRLNTPYQRMIRNLLDLYASKYRISATTDSGQRSKARA